MVTLILVRSGTLNFHPLFPKLHQMPTLAEIRHDSFKRLTEHIKSCVSSVVFLIHHHHHHHHHPIAPIRIPAPHRLPHHFIITIIRMDTTMDNKSTWVIRDSTPSFAIAKEIVPTRPKVKLLQHHHPTTIVRRFKDNIMDKALTGALILLLQVLLAAVLVERFVQHPSKWEKTFKWT